MDNWPLIRTIILFIGGMTGAVVVTVHWLQTAQEPSFALLTLFAGMLGLPFFLGKDEGGKK